MFVCIVENNRCKGFILGLRLNVKHSFIDLVVSSCKHGRTFQNVNSHNKQVLILILVQNVFNFREMRKEMLQPTHKERLFLLLCDCDTGKASADSCVFSRRWRSFMRLAIKLYSFVIPS